MKIRIGITEFSRFEISDQVVGNESRSRLPCDTNEGVRLYTMLCMGAGTGRAAQERTLGKS